MHFLDLFRILSDYILHNFYYYILHNFFSKFLSFIIYLFLLNNLTILYIYYSKKYTTIFCTIKCTIKCTIFCIIFKIKKNLISKTFFGIFKIFFLNLNFQKKFLKSSFFDF